MEGAKIGRVKLPTNAAARNAERPIGDIHELGRGGLPTKQRAKFLVH
jgi:hypothetical protein